MEKADLQRGGWRLEYLLVVRFQDGQLAQSSIFIAVHLNTHKSHSHKVRSKLRRTKETLI